MKKPNSPTRRALLKGGVAAVAMPVAGAAAQSGPAAAHKEAATFNLWVISDCHVGTDKAVSEGIQHGLVGFKPPPVYFESLAEPLRQSETAARSADLRFRGTSRSISATTRVSGTRPRMSRGARWSANMLC